MDDISITEFDSGRHREQVMFLWRAIFGYETAHNEPGLVIDKKVAVNDHLFFVALQGDCVIGTIMAGYDGHRGWIYALAVLESHRKKGIGTALLNHAENKLAGLGCVKINLQIIESNKTVEAFYLANGYVTEKRISMGKRLNANA